MSELKPCPFCGGEAKLMLDKCSGVYFVGCSNDKCLGYGAIGWSYETAEEAIKAWNTRHERTCKLNQEGFSIAAVAVCDKCGDRFSVYAMAPEMFNYCPNCGAKVVGE